ncbi:MAG TPA: 3,4-dehydroadipyl-CoA semialdehyde dehydrogenase [Thermoanaerobaculia bacterium]|jgi:oxepin-CoA hydrolase/3-oxo-5,6-dehydrosuberyl-CoA semialdehyde dehydrogenase|nr:3,4-dehydroadipyl-CoA semialdehyde dehydrogenase [Thermoanaerobaculia bacterium]
MSEPLSAPIRIESYVEERWVAGEGPGSTLVNPATGEALATASTTGIDLGAALRHAREVGGPALRALNFAQRAGILKGLAGAIKEHRDELLSLAMKNGGNTKGDAKFDVDGASGTLAFYANLGRGLGEARYLLDGEAVPLGRATPLAGRHVWVPRRGAAVLVNAYNFPAWGFAEKVACAFLAGMPVVVKPATQTALVAWRIARLFVDSSLLPAGGWTFLAGPAGDLLDHLEAQDVLAFTGSAATGAKMRAHPRVLEKGVRVNVEADSLNAAVLGPDVAPGSPTWELFVKEVVHEMTQKAGQKCTATRRVFVPRERLQAARAALVGKLGEVRVGDPADEGVGMGPVVSDGQRRDVEAGVAEIARGAAVAWTGEAPSGNGFVAARLLVAEDPRAAAAVHRREVFGPVATLMAYDGTAEEAGELVGLGEGSLVSSVYSDDAEFVAAATLAMAPFNGRVYIGAAEVAAEALGPGTVLPGLVHGGPGRAGSGEELGGLRGLHHYMQRTAVQGPKAVLDRIGSEGVAG